MKSWENLRSFAAPASLILTLSFIIGGFQNCGEPLSADGTDVNSSLSSGTPTAMPSSLSATYSPNPAVAGATVTLAAFGGSPPYTFTLSSGSGTLNGNHYFAPSDAETAVITAIDNYGDSVTLQIQTYAVGASPSPSPSPTASPGITPTPSPSPSAHSRTFNGGEFTLYENNSLTVGNLVVSLDGNGNFAGYLNSNLWAPVFSYPTGSLNCASPIRICVLGFQADGNLRSYDGVTFPWSSNTAGTGVTFRLWDTAPYIGIFNAESTKIWPP